MAVQCCELAWTSDHILFQSTPPSSSKHTYLLHNSLSQILIEHFLFTPCHYVLFTKRVIHWKEIIHFLQNNSEPHGRASGWLFSISACLLLASPIHWISSKQHKMPSEPCSDGSNFISGKRSPGLLTMLMAPKYPGFLSGRSWIIQFIFHFKMTTESFNWIPACGSNRKSYS